MGSNPGNLLKSLLHTLIDIFLFFSAVFAPILVFGCLPEPYRRQSRSRIFNKDNDVTVNVEKVFSLNRQGETVSIRPNLNARQGQSIYGR